MLGSGFDSFRLTSDTETSPEAFSFSDNSAYVGGTGSSAMFGVDLKLKLINTILFLSSNMGMISKFPIIDLSKATG